VHVYLIESVEHFLLDCDNYSKVSEVMKDTIEDLVLPVKQKRSLRITEHLFIIVPMTKISVKQACYL